MCVETLQVSPKPRTWTVMAQTQEGLGTPSGIGDDAMTFPLPARNRLSDCGRLDAENARLRAPSANRPSGPYHSDHLPDRVRRSEGSRSPVCPSPPQIACA